MSEGANLDSHHLATVERIFRHPAGHNIEWHAVLSLLRSVGTVIEEHDGRFKVTLGSETEIFDTRRGRDVDEQQVVDLRRMLRGAGLAPESA
jgi:hypothetical protein